MQHTKGSRLIGRSGVPDARKLYRDAEIWHAWRPLTPLYAEKWIARRQINADVFLTVKHIH